MMKPIRETRSLRNPLQALDLVPRTAAWSALRSSVQNAAKARFPHLVSIDINGPQPALGPTSRYVCSKLLRRKGLFHGRSCNRPKIPERGILDQGNLRSGAAPQVWVSPRNLRQRLAVPQALLHSNALRRRRSYRQLPRDSHLAPRS